MILRLLAAFLVLAASSCKDRTGTAKPSARNDSTSYFPVNQFLLGEIRKVDSLQIGIRTITSIGEQSDTTYIDNAKFHALAAQFFSRETESPEFEESFDQSSFFDNTAEVFTFTFMPRNDETAIKRVDVLVNPGEGTNKVRSIYIEKDSSEGGEMKRFRMFWRAGKSLQISSEQPREQGDPVVKTIIASWNYWDQ